MERLRTLAQDATVCSYCFEHHNVRRAFVDVAQPRLIGTAYWATRPRLAWLMINPGAGKGSSLDERWRNLLRGLRSGQEQLETVFEFQRTNAKSMTPQLVAFLKGYGLTMDTLALVNVAWCSTIGNDYPPAMLDSCWKRHTRRWLTELEPDLVVLSGSATSRVRSALLELLPVSKVIQTWHFRHRRGFVAEKEEQLRVRRWLCDAGVELAA